MTITALADLVYWVIKPREQTCILVENPPMAFPGAMRRYERRDGRFNQKSCDHCDGTCRRVLRVLDGYLWVSEGEYV